MAAALPLAFAERLGYLTACPTNVGTGLRASAMVHLPGLCLSGQMDKVTRALNQDGLAVRGWLGEGTEAAGNIYQISNQQTLGLAEEDALDEPGHLEDGRAVALGEEPLEVSRPVRADRERHVALDHRAGAPTNWSYQLTTLSP